MAFKIEYSVAAKPDVVLATIRREAPYWRESTIPRELRTAGTFGVAARVGQSSFHLHREDWNDPPYRNADLRGRVEPAESGSLIVVRVGLGRAWIVAPLIFGVLAVWTMMSNRGGGLVLLAITAVFAVWDFFCDRSISPEDPIAQHLVGRLELALSRIGENAIPASTPRAI